MKISSMKNLLWRKHSKKIQLQQQRPEVMFKFNLSLIKDNGLTKIINKIISTFNQ